VGQTEAAIARMFSEATRNDAVLLLDEADGLLRRRENAVRSWEVTQVNEMLSRMEDFPGIFLCSTNHNDALDPAAMRRFLFKLNFEYLNEQQALVLTERHLGFSLTADDRNYTEKKLSEMQTLTPADFSNVTERLTYLGIEFDIKTFLEQLKSEIDAKLEIKGRKMGFGGLNDC
jgi:SpoVK/Ycf46/Vps4 family AAA+-type ATPase